MLRGFFGNLIFAIIARMLCRNHLKLNSPSCTLLHMALQALAQEFLKVPHNRFQHFSDESSTQKLNEVLYLLHF